MIVPMSRVLFFILLSAGLISCTSNTSDAYSELSGTKCSQLTLDEVTGSSSDRCPGPAGYIIDVLFDNNRASINVITPDQREYEQNNWEIVSSGISTLHGPAKWLMKRQNDVSKPTALIVKMNTIEHDEANQPRTTSYFVISKITPETVCITDKIVATKSDIHLVIKDLANTAESRPCLAGGDIESSQDIESIQDIESTQDIESIEDAKDTGKAKSNDKTKGTEKTKSTDDIRNEEYQEYLDYVEKAKSAPSGGYIEQQLPF